jgi:hypothetical protein
MANYVSGDFLVDWQRSARIWGWLRPSEQFRGLMNFEIEAAAVVA